MYLCATACDGRTTSNINALAERQHGIYDAHALTAG